MKGTKKIYSFSHLASAVFMIAALLWLTISAPFVFASQQQIAKQNKMVNSQSPVSANEEEGSNNTAEHKAPSANSFSEEYLHDAHADEHFFSMDLQYHKCEDADTYIAFHGELLVPPPNAA